MDWWLDAFLPLGALPPARLQAAINSAYTAAEEQDGTALAAESVLQAVPEAEAEVLRAELARIKLSGGEAAARAACQRCPAAQTRRKPLLPVLPAAVILAAAPRPTHPRPLCPHPHLQPVAWWTGA